MVDARKKNLLALGISRLQAKPRDKKRLYEFFTSGKNVTTDDFFSASAFDIARIIGDTAVTRRFDGKSVCDTAEQDVEDAEKRGVHWRLLDEADYPPLLREIDDPPVILFYRGTLPDPEMPLIAIVGTRKPSGNAARAAFDISREMGVLGYPVVSGLALGTDALCHRGCIEGGAPTFAVLGSSPDEVFPATNRDLARRVIERGGGLLSEYPPGTRPEKWRFPARNRIISGLARGTVVVEAPEKSGALITARAALEQGRDLWVAKIGLLSAGTAKLEENGAKVINSAEDVLMEWGRLIEKKEIRENLRISPVQAEFSPTALADSLSRELF